MKKTLTFELDEDQVLELFEVFVKEQETDDPINSLSIVFREYEDSDVYEPTLFFCPNWQFDYEAGLCLTDALQEYLDDETNDDDDRRDLVKRLLATTDEWIRQQKTKEEAP